MTPRHIIGDTGVQFAWQEVSPSSAGWGTLPTGSACQCNASADSVTVAQRLGMVMPRALAPPRSLR